MEYELLFFISLTNEGKILDIKKEIEETITGRDGKISAEFSDIGKRKFAYPIKKQTHGFFSFCRFSLDEKENLSEINRRLSLNDKIMRHLIVRADEIGRPISEQISHEERPNADEKKIKEKTEAAAKDEEKVGITGLDEKLEEILEETPG